MFKWKSKTLIFNLILIGAGIFAPNLESETRNLLILNGIAGIGLRASTKEPLYQDKK